MTDNFDISLELAGRVAGRSSVVEVAAAVYVGASLPGLSIQLDGIRAGLALRLTLGGDGQLEVSAEPVLPKLTGAGVQLELPGVDGGGSLSIVGDEWRGALSADLGPVTVSGFAILNVREFSLLVLLAAEFAVPIQLSFGFTLIGVGGIIGINRRPDIDELHAAANSGELGRMLFPHDAAAEAPALLPALDHYFPAHPGSFIVGPMVKLGWGTPTLVSAAVGVLITTEGVVIVGQVAIVLPFEQAALIKLQATVFGTITEDGLDLGASLTDSHIAGMPVTGDLALRIGGGKGGLFVLSAGGFHPAFAPPEGMTGMRRLGAEISPGPILRLRLDAYLAVTTGSVQFGAHAELSAGIGGFGIRGSLGFDVLITLDPFGFQADFGATVSVECIGFSVASLSMNGHLSGTAPWRIRGHASVKVVLKRVSIDIPELTWGHRAAAALPPARDPYGVLAAELGRPENWTAVNDRVPALVRLRPSAGSQSAVHPLAELVFVQNAVPLSIELTRMDAVPLPAPMELTVVPVGAEPRVPAPTAEFAPTQFLSLDDNAKLASAGYAELPAGFAVAVTALVSGAFEVVDSTPEVRVIKPDSVQILAAKVDFPAARVAAVAITEPPTLVVLHDPRDCIVTHVGDLQSATETLTERLGYDRDQIELLTRHPGIAETLARTAGLGELQLTRAWEVATP